jgi:hypothetical protein
MFCDLAGNSGHVFDHYITDSDLLKLVFCSVLLSVILHFGRG